MSTDPAGQEVSQSAAGSAFQDQDFEDFSALGALINSNDNNINHGIDNMFDLPSLGQTGLGGLLGFDENIFGFDLFGGEDPTVETSLATPGNIRPYSDEALEASVQTVPEQNDYAQTNAPIDTTEPALQLSSSPGHIPTDKSTSPIVSSTPTTAEPENTKDSAVGPTKSTEVVPDITEQPEKANHQPENAPPIFTNQPHGNFSTSSTSNFNQLPGQDAFGYLSVNAEGQIAPARSNLGTFGLEEFAQPKLFPCDSRLEYFPNKLVDPYQRRFENVLHYIEINQDITEKALQRCPDVVNRHLQTDHAAVTQFLDHNPPFLDKYLADNPKKSESLYRQKLVNAYLAENPKVLHRALSQDYIDAFVQANPRKFAKSLSQNQDFLNEYLANNPARLVNALKANPSLRSFVHKEHEDSYTVAMVIYVPENEKDEVDLTAKPVLPGDPIKRKQVTDARNRFDQTTKLTSKLENDSDDSTDLDTSEDEQTWQEEESDKEDDGDDRDNNQNEADANYIHDEYDTDDDRDEAANDKAVEVSCHEKSGDAPETPKEVFGSYDQVSIAPTPEPYLDFDTQTIDSPGSTSQEKHISNLQKNHHGSKTSGKPTFSGNHRQSGKTYKSSSNNVSGEVVRKGHSGLPAATKCGTHHYGAASNEERLHAQPVRPPKQTKTKPAKTSSIRPTKMGATVDESASEYEERQQGVRHETTGRPKRELEPYPAPGHLIEKSRHDLPKGKEWRLFEQDLAIAHMLNIRDEGAFQGEERFREVSRRLERENTIERNWLGVKNFWNRIGRERSGFDERKNKNAPLSTSAQGKSAKAEYEVAKKQRQKKVKPTKSSFKRKRDESIAVESNESDGDEPRYPRKKSSTYTTSAAKSINEEEDVQQTQPQSSQPYAYVEVENDEEIQELDEAELRSAALGLRKSQKINYSG